MRISFGEQMDICAFSACTRELVWMGFPHDWAYREDVGGAMQHHWEYLGVLAMRATKTTCATRIRPSIACRNCAMKRSWKLACETPEYAFCVWALHDDEGQQALERLATWRMPVSDIEVAAYERLFFDKKWTLSKAITKKLENLKLLANDIAQRTSIANLAHELETKDEDDLLDLLDDSHSHFLKSVATQTETTFELNVQPTPLKHYATSTPIHIRGHTVQPVGMPQLHEWTDRHQGVTQLRLAFYTPPTRSMHLQLLDNKVPPFLTSGWKGPIAESPAPTIHIPSYCVIVPLEAIKGNLAFAPEMLFLGLVTAVSPKQSS